MRVRVPRPALIRYIDYMRIIGTNYKKLNKSQSRGISVPHIRMGRNSQEYRILSFFSKKGVSSVIEAEHDLGISLGSVYRVRSAALNLGLIDHIRSEEDPEYVLCASYDRRSLRHGRSAWCRDRGTAPLLRKTEALDEFLKNVELF